MGETSNSARTGAASVSSVASLNGDLLKVPLASERLCEDRGRGTLPILVVGTVGTTAHGAIDDLNRIAVIAEANHCWLHVDAAWGGSACFARRLRPWLNGVQRADSIAWDAHKWLSVPMGAGMFLTRHKSVLQRLFSVRTAYLPEPGDAEVEPYQTTLQWSRRFIGLKVFLALACRGEARLEARIERQLDAAAYLRARLRTRGWTIINDSPLPLVCFTRGAWPDSRLEELVARIQQRGRAWISHTRIDGVAVARACITNDDTTRADVDVLLEELEAARQVE